MPQSLAAERRCRPWWGSGTSAPNSRDCFSVQLPALTQVPTRWRLRGKRNRGVAVSTRSRPLQTSIFLARSIERTVETPRWPTGHLIYHVDYADWPPLYHGLQKIESREPIDENNVKRGYLHYCLVDKRKRCSLASILTVRLCQTEKKTVKIAKSHESCPNKKTPGHQTLAPTSMGLRHRDIYIQIHAVQKKKKKRKTPS